MTTSIVNEEALDRFIRSADLNEARRTEAALEAMAASVRLRIVELETTSVHQADFSPDPSSRVD
jgi:hypothetical protein